MRLPAARHAMAGFHAELPAPALPELLTLGEAWLASRTDIADHAHEMWEVYLQLDGETQWHDRGGARLLRAGDGYLAGPGVRHHLGTVQGTRHHFVFAIIDIDGWVARRLPPLVPLCQRARRHAKLFTGEAEALRPALRLLIAAASRDSPRRDLALAAALDAVCIATLEWAVEPVPASLRPEHRAVAVVRERIDAAPGRRWTLAELASRTGLGPKRLCTIFGEEVGQTPHQYLMAARLEGIRRALASTDLSITQLAEDFGFSSSQHLAKVFVAKSGMSARAFRKAGRRAE